MVVDDASFKLGQLQMRSTPPGVETPASRQPSLGHASLESASSMPSESGSNDAASSLERQSTAVERVQARAVQLCTYFKLPADENLRDDFWCALHKKVILQGRLFVMEHYVCFHSKVFGYTKDRVIALKDVTQVRKRKHLGLPNSIEIVYCNGTKSDFFTSFLSRGDAFALIVRAWRSSGAPVTPHALKTGAAVATLSGMGSPHRSMSLPHEGTPGNASPVRRVVTQRRDAMPQNAARFDQQSTSPQEGQWHAQEGDAQAADGMDRDGDSSDADSDSASGSPANGQPVWPEEQDGTPQPLSSEMKLLAEGQLDCSVTEFCQRLLADDASFFRDYHESRGDKEFRLSRWKSHPQLGHVRELNFVSPIKAVIGPSQAACSQTQRYSLFKGGHLVFETTQVMADIPYGDHFAVESRWDVKSAGEGKCEVKSHCAVPFSKHTMWKKTIMKSTMESCKSAHQDLIAQARTAVTRQAGGPPVSAFADESRKSFLQADMEETLGSLPLQTRDSVVRLLSNAAQSNMQFVPTPRSSGAFGRFRSSQQPGLSVQSKLGSRSSYQSAAGMGVEPSTIVKRPKAFVQPLLVILGVALMLVLQAVLTAWLVSRLLPVQQVGVVAGSPINAGGGTAGDWHKALEGLRQQIDTLQAQHKAVVQALQKSAPAVSTGTSHL